MVEYSCKIEEKVKAMKNKIKEKVHGTSSEGKETGTQEWLGAEGRNKHSTGTHEETRIQKNEEKHRYLWHNFQHSNI